LYISLRFLRFHRGTEVELELVLELEKGTITPLAYPLFILFTLLVETGGVLVEVEVEGGVGVTLGLFGGLDGLFGGLDGLFGGVLGVAPCGKKVGLKNPFIPCCGRPLGPPNCIIKLLFTPLLNGLTVGRDTT